MTLPEIYRKSPDAIQSYDSIDFATGAGIINFYAGESKNSGALAYSLSRNAFYSREITSGAYLKTEHVSNVSIFNKNFETIFSKTFVMQGPALVTIPFGMESLNALGTLSGAVAATLYKVDGVTGTATEIVPVVSGATMAMVNVAGNRRRTETLVFDNIPATTFKEKDILRLNVNLLEAGITTGGSAQFITVGLGIDPKNRAEVGYFSGAFTNSHPTELVLQVPFKINT